MNAPPRIERRHSTCPHDCPSTCALDVEVIDGRTIGRVHGSEDNSYTAGVICAKVARYAERIHHPDRLTHPLRRTGPKGSGQFRRISWDEALDLVAEAFLTAERALGPEAVWPYYYAGTMGLVMRDGINRLRHAKRYSGEFTTICTNMAWTGCIAGTGKLAGADPREMGVVRLRRDLGHERGAHAGQRDDPRDAGAQGARREDRRRRHLRQRHHEAGGPAAPGEARHRRGARLRGHARAVPRRLRGLGLPRRIHGLSARARGASAQPRSCLGVGHHRPAGRRDRGLREARRHDASRPSSGSATASGASATASSTCTPPPASRRSPAPGSTRAAAPSTTTARSTTGARP